MFTKCVYVERETSATGVYTPSSSFVRPLLLLIALNGAIIRSREDSLRSFRMILMLSEIMVGADQLMLSRTKP